MEVFLILTGVAAFALSGLLYFFLRTGAKSLVISVVVPILFLILYVISIRDEFGFWALVFTFGLLVCLIGSTFGIFAVSRLKKKSE